MLTRGVILLFVLSALTSCSRARQQQAGTAAGSIPMSWVVRLVPTVATGTRILGDARVSPSTKPGHVHVSLDIAGGAISNRHPWAIVSGACNEINGIEVGGRAAYVPIELGTDGSKRMEVDVPVTLNMDRRYHIALYANATTDRNLVVSCGELRPITR
jgi:hypothetical protein